MKKDVLVKKAVDSGNDSYGFKEVLNVDNDYTYDVNGNMTKDLNKGITNISYNHLNLPTRVTIGGKNIDYTYDAVGIKLSKTVSGVATQYAGNYIYENGVLQFFNHPEGYVSPKNASDISQGFKYVYQYKDHLGNVRLSYADQDKDGVITPSTEIIEESNYYPFGLEHKGYNNNISSLGNSTAQKFGYNGKELNDDLVGGSRLNWHDFGARNYDASLGRWMNLDPLAEEMRRYSPYNFAFDNPIYFVDPDGMAPKSPDDVIVLTYGKFRPGHGTGHQAILIGDDETGWTFYSKDKDYGTEDGKNDQFTIKTFGSVKEFANSEYNTFKSDYDDGKGKETSHIDSKGKVMQRFRDGYRIKTTKKQDASMKKAAETETKKDYSLTKSNCTHNCKAALDAGGLKNGESTTSTLIDRRNGDSMKASSPNFTPNAKQEEIKKSNKGVDISNQLKPTEQ
ncbi:RHS repeat domain-containing protein [Tenacibaculum maritimum]|uniref:RHS repeat domain-containing protein n=2 Tax=Tenacibaculum maritimum TaxID=107401 RepID=UPI0038767A84